MPTYRVSQTVSYLFTLQFVVDAENEDDAVEAVPDWSIAEAVHEEMASVGGALVDWERYTVAPEFDVQRL